MARASVKGSWVILGTETVRRASATDKDDWAIDCWNDISSTVLSIDAVGEQDG